MSSPERWRLLGGEPRQCRTVNICSQHDPSMGGLYQAVVEFSRALPAGILSIEPEKRRYQDQANDVYRLEYVGHREWLAKHYIKGWASTAMNGLLAEVDLLIAHSLFRGHVAFVRQWAEASGKHYWAVPHGCLDPWGMAQRSWLKRLWMAGIGQDYLANARWVIFATKREREKAAKWLTRARPVVVHFPVRVPELSTKEEAKRRFRAKLGIEDGERLLLFVGRLHPMKRPRELVEAFGRADVRNVTLLMVGAAHSPNGQQLQRKINKAASDKVHFTGPLHGEDLRQVWLAADGFISLSQRENFGFSLAEAFSYGLPAIVTPGHDLIHEMPCDGSRSSVGWSLPDQSEVAAIQAIREFSQSDDAVLATYGATARRWVSEMLDPNRFSDHLRGLAQ